MGKNEGNFPMKHSCYRWTQHSSAFGTDDTVQFFEGQRFSKSVFLMRYRGPPDLTDPKIFFTYDLKLDNVSIR